MLFILLIRLLSQVLTRWSVRVILVLTTWSIGRIMVNPVNVESDERKQRIFDAALVEFAARGYEKASTNEIVRSANVSKGLLFHYFGSKKELYLYVLDKCLEFAKGYFMRHTGDMPGDIIERIIRFTEIKLQMFKDAPLIYQFFVSVFVDAPQELQGEITKRNQELEAAFMPLLTEDINHDCFRDDIDAGKALELIMLVVDAIGDKYVKVCKEANSCDSAGLEAAFEDMRTSLEMLKYGIYRKRFYKK